MCAFPGLLLHWFASLSPLCTELICKTVHFIDHWCAVIFIHRPTSETLEAMSKQCRSEAETARRAVRTARKDAMAAVKSLPAEDERFKVEKEVQKLTDSFVANIDKLAADKEQTMSMV